MNRKQQSEQRENKNQTIAKHPQNKKKPRKFLGE